jgi:hypothetical protein
MTTIQLHINKIDRKTEELSVDTYTVGHQSLLQAIDNFGAYNQGNDLEIDLEATHETERVLLELNITPPNEYNYYWSVFAE